MRCPRLPVCASLPPPPAARTAQSWASPRTLQLREAARACAFSGCLSYVAAARRKIQHTVQPKTLYIHIRTYYSRRALVVVVPNSTFVFCSERARVYRALLRCTRGLSSLLSLCNPRARVQLPLKNKNRKRNPFFFFASLLCILLPSAFLYFYFFFFNNSNDLLLFFFCFFYNTLWTFGHRGGHDVCRKSKR